MSPNYLILIIILCAAVLGIIFFILYRRKKMGGMAPDGDSDTEFFSGGMPEPADMTGKLISRIVMSCDAGEVHAPCEGKIRSYTEIPDETFASGVLGEGVGIEPSDDSVYAPFDGTISSVSDAKHAIGITGPGGMELLIHVGVDTVSMNGEGFNLFVEEDDRVKAGQKLMQFDRKKIAADGHPDIIVVLMTNSSDMTHFKVSY